MSDYEKPQTCPRCKVRDGVWIFCEIHEGWEEEREAQRSYQSEEE